MKCFVRGKMPSDSYCINVVGCRAKEFKEHLETQFREGWTWSNYGHHTQGKVWNIDHLRPYSSFNLLDPCDARMANHWTNLVPCDSVENDLKRDTYCS